MPPRRRACSEVPQTTPEAYESALAGDAPSDEELLSTACKNDPTLLIRLRLAHAIPIRQRICADVFVETRNSQKAMEAAGYKPKNIKMSWSRLMVLPKFRAYLDFMEALKMQQPDSTWCLDRLVDIVHDPKATASARVAAVERIGRMKQVKGLCDSEDVKAAANVVVPVKVFVNVPIDQL